MRRVDAHHHVWDLGVRDQPWTAAIPRLRHNFAVDDLLGDLERARIEGTVVVQTVCVAEETPELLELAARTPTVLGVVGWVDLTDAGAGERIDALRAGVGGELLVGIRHQVQAEPAAWLARPDVRRGLAQLAARGLVYDLVVTSDQLAAVVEVVRALPDLRFVLDHAGKPRPDGDATAFDHWRRCLTELAGCANLAVKLSGLSTELDPPRWDHALLAPVATHVRDLFAADRLMFGSDWPVCLLSGGYADAVAATSRLVEGLSVAEQAAFWGGTAVEVYGLAP